MQIPYVLTDAVTWMGLIIEIGALLVAYHARERVFYSTFLLVNVLIGCVFATDIVTLGNGAHSIGAQLALTFVPIGIIMGYAQFGPPHARNVWIGALYGIIMYYLWTHRFLFDTDLTLGTLTQSFALRAHKDTSTIVAIALGMIYVHAPLQVFTRWLEGRNFLIHYALPIYLGVFTGGAFFVFVSKFFDPNVTYPLFYELLDNVLFNRMLYVTITMPFIYYMVRRSRF